MIVNDLGLPMCFFPILAKFLCYRSVMIVQLNPTVKSFHLHSYLQKEL